MKFESWMVPVGLSVAGQLVLWGRLQNKVKANCISVKKTTNKLDPPDGEPVFMTVKHCEGCRQSCGEKTALRYESYDRRIESLKLIVHQDKIDRKEEMIRVHTKLDEISKTLIEVVTQLKERNK